VQNCSFMTQIRINYHYKMFITNKNDVYQKITKYNVLFIFIK